MAVFCIVLVFERYLFFKEVRMPLACCEVTEVVVSFIPCSCWEKLELGHFPALCLDGKLEERDWSPWRLCSHFIDKLTSNPLFHFNFSIHAYMS